jgi:hypothetical protein
MDFDPHVFSNQYTDEYMNDSDILDENSPYEETKKVEIDGKIYTNSYFRKIQEELFIRYSLHFD